MITGAHCIIYSKNAEADRAFFRDILKFTNVDVGDGWLIFGLPHSELAVHPSDENDTHELYLLCDNINDFISEMKTHGIDCSDVHNAGWGLLTKLSLPGVVLSEYMSHATCSPNGCNNNKIIRLNIR